MVSDPGCLLDVGRQLNRLFKAQFKDVNNPTTIKWSASSSQIGARTLRIRTTEAFAGGRPQITVNSFTPSAPSGKQLLDGPVTTRR